MKALIPASELTAVTGWKKSSRSGAAGHCVEMARLGDGVVLRNSNDPESGGLAFTGDEIAAFVAGVKAGEFDYLVD